VNMRGSSEGLALLAVTSSASDGSRDSQRGGAVL